MAFHYSNYHTVEVGVLSLNRDLDIIEMDGDLENDSCSFEKLKDVIRAYERSYQFIAPAKLKDITIQFEDYYLKVDMTKDPLVVRKYILNKQNEQTL